MKKQSDFIRFMKLLEKQLPVYLLSIFFLETCNAGNKVVTTFVIQILIDGAIKGTLKGTAVAITIGLVIAFISIFARMFFMFKYNKAARTGLAKVRKLVFSKLSKLPMSYFENTHSGDFASRLLYDSEQASSIYTEKFFRFTGPAILVVYYLISMVIFCWQLMPFMVLLTLLMLFVNSKFSKPIKDQSKKLSKKNSELSVSLTNLLAGIAISKTYRASETLTQKYEQQNKDYTQNYIKRSFQSSCLNGLNTAFNLICNLVFFAIGVYFVQIKIVTLGNLIASFVMVEVFIREFLQIGRFLPEIFDALVNVRRVFSFLDEPEEPTKYAMPTANQNEYIDICNLSFSYNDDREILQNFSMSVPKGKVIALTGQSGSGKSTIAKLLLGFYPPSSGTIIVDGKTTEQIGLYNLREQIAYVPQEAYIYNTTIKENIKYGRYDATDEEIIEAAKAANAHDFILRQPDGYETITGERGSRLSGGERQRIAIARAILRNAPILLLDEATSALDNESEQLVQGALNNLMKNRTTIMIAHRPSTIASADIILNIS